MISRKYKLLVRPWEQQHYENHRRKVQSAVPVIDAGPPTSHKHVFYKQKKQQKELERCSKIENDNLRLLQRMTKIMNKSRVDNKWNKEQPKILNRVTLYNININKNTTKTKEQFSVSEEKTRKGRCFACTPKKPPSPKIPEERVPWEPIKPLQSRKRSDSLPSRRIENLDAEKEKNPSPKDKPQEIKQIQKRINKPVQSRKIGNSISLSSIILKRDGLHLAVNFPSDTLVQLKDGVTEKCLTSGPCHCKAIRSKVNKE